MQMLDWGLAWRASSDSPVLTRLQTESYVPPEAILSGSLAGIIAMTCTRVSCMLGCYSTFIALSQIWK